MATDGAGFLRCNRLCCSSDGLCKLLCDDVGLQAGILMSNLVIDRVCHDGTFMQTVQSVSTSVI